MNNKHRDVLDAYAHRAELGRHDPPLADLRPHEVGEYIFDWAAPMVAVGRGLHQLDEALPNNQLDRTRQAYKLLRAGCDALGVYLRSRGVDV